MKKKVIKFVESLGGRTAYCGEERTMYIYSSNINTDIELRVTEKFGPLPFKLLTNTKLLEYEYPNMYKS